MSDIIRYLTGNNFPRDLMRIVQEYETNTWIGAFMKVDPQNTGNRWFYEWTIQGILYQLLTRLSPPERGEYLYFLEQPYSPNSTVTRSDIMIVDIHTENIYSIEIKNDLNNDVISLSRHLCLCSFPSTL